MVDPWPLSCPTKSFMKWRIALENVTICLLVSTSFLTPLQSCLLANGIPQFVSNLQLPFHLKKSANGLQRNHPRRSQMKKKRSRELEKSLDFRALVACSVDSSMIWNAKSLGTGLTLKMLWICNVWRLGSFCILPVFRQSSLSVAYWVRPLEKIWLLWSLLCLDLFAVSATAFSPANHWLF